MTDYNHLASKDKMLEAPVPRSRAARRTVGQCPASCTTAIRPKASIASSKSGANFGRLSPSSGAACAPSRRSIPRSAKRWRNATYGASRSWPPARASAAVARTTPHRSAQYPLRANKPRRLPHHRRPGPPDRRSNAAHPAIGPHTAWQAGALGEAAADRTGEALRRESA